ncbi:MAG TPA: 3-deoxy-manno-octulosonate cytidylyltransferase [bacterium]|nr:3-deoxy-manno-octulosonate cytidylyltransferase [bacterium]
MNVVAVIPARYQSSRFPGKPLALIRGIPMIVRVWQQVRQARLAGEVLVATDDSRIAKVITDAGGTAVLTDPDLPSGTDRVAAVAAASTASIVVNVQGDEPLIDPSSIDRAIETLRDTPGADMATLAVPLHHQDDVWNPNIVKVLLNHHGNAVYFSRTPIPHPASRTVSDSHRYLRHIGLYVYRQSCLQQLVRCRPCWSEQVERLEQLRALHHGMTIAVGVVESAYPGVDTPEDIAIIENILDPTESKALDNTME